MIWLVALLVTSNLFFTNAATTDCCYPDTLEYDLYNVETGESTTAAYDYTKKRFYETQDESGQVFVIVDFGAQKRYSFVNGQCSSSPFTKKKIFEQCVHDDLRIPNFFFGNLGPNLESDILGFGYREDRDRRFLLLSKIDDGSCVPVLIQDVLGGGPLTDTNVVSKVSTTISESSQKIYSDVSKCR